jgi:hypothetical protein
MDLSLSIILNTNRIALLLTCRDWRYQIEHKLIIDLQVWNSDSIFIVRAASDLLKNLWYSSRDHASILIVLHASAHCECFSSASLTVYHNSPVETLDHRLNNVLRTGIEDIFLAWIMKDLVKFETPWFLLIVYVTSMLILWNVYIYMLSSHESIYLTLVVVSI